MFQDVTRDGSFFALCFLYQWFLVSQPISSAMYIGISCLQYYQYLPGCYRYFLLPYFSGMSRFHVYRCLLLPVFLECLQYRVRRSGDSRGHTRERCPYSDDGRLRPAAEEGGWSQGCGPGVSETARLLAGAARVTYGKLLLIRTLTAHFWACEATLCLQ